MEVESMVTTMHSTTSSFFCPRESLLWKQLRKEVCFGNNDEKCQNIWALWPVIISHFKSNVIGRGTSTSLTQSAALAFWAFDACAQVIKKCVSELMRTSDHARCHLKSGGTKWKKVSAASIRWLLDSWLARGDILSKLLSVSASCACCCSLPGRKHGWTLGWKWPWCSCRHETGGNSALAPQVKTHDQGERIVFF